MANTSNYQYLLIVCQTNFTHYSIPNRHFDLLDLSTDTPLPDAPTAGTRLAYKFIPLYRFILELNLVKLLKSRNTHLF